MSRHDQDDASAAQPRRREPRRIPEREWERLKRDARGRHHQPKHSNEPPPQDTDGKGTVR